MKCLPASKVSLAKGNVLHDWHAEVLALRGFNRFIVDECKDGRGEWITQSEKEQQLFQLNEGVGIHLYCSEAPCGDASMELVMRMQEDDTPWSTPAPAEGEMAGRGHFDQLGVVRRKPARSDAPATLSKSCSDKIAMKQVTGLLGGLGSLVVSERGMWLDTVVMPESQVVPEAVERAFGAEGRMRALEGWKGNGGYTFRPFKVLSTSREFEYSGRMVGADPVPSNLSTLWTPRRQEILINGVLQGRKQFNPKGASCVSRRGMWKSVLEVAVMAGLPAVVDVLRKGTYGEVKGSTMLMEREEAKRRAKELGLNGWVKNEEDHCWGLDE